MNRRGRRYECSLDRVTRRKAHSSSKQDGSEASLVVVYGADLGRRVPLTQAEFNIGRSSRSDLFVDQDAVSRKHAMITYAKGHYTLVDLRSSNGTRVNEERIKERVLQDGDRIEVGETILTFLSGSDVETRSQDQIYKLLTVDGLTGAHNKRYFGEALEREHGRALRYARSLSVVLFDIDGFETLAKDRGVAAANEVLRYVARAIHKRLRQQDILGRLGGASFGILFPEIDRAGVVVAAEKVRALVESTGVPHGEEMLSCTLSLGVATLTKREALPAELLSDARRALEKAKKAGGNRAEAPAVPMPTPIPRGGP